MELAKRKKAEMKGRQGLLDGCRKWTKSEPDNATVWNKLGFAYANLNRHDDCH